MKKFHFTLKLLYSCLTLFLPSFFFTTQNNIYNNEIRDERKNLDTFPPIRSFLFSLKDNKIRGDTCEVVPIFPRNFISPLSTFLIIVYLLLPENVFLLYINETLITCYFPYAYVTPRTFFPLRTILVLETSSKFINRCLSSFHSIRLTFR